MNVLVACEFSGVVRDAFRSRGHEAWSCDLLPCERDGRYHFQGDVRNILKGPRDILPVKFKEWDLVLFFPPCTHLASSGARYFAEKRRDGRQQDAIEFFMLVPKCLSGRWVIENPVGIMSTVYRKPDQIIHPWLFGHPESKTTCLWLNNLPKLCPTDLCFLPPSGRWTNQTPSGQNKLGPHPDRAKNRSRTYQGIADAMAEQWGY